MEMMKAGDNVAMDTVAVAAETLGSLGSSLAQSQRPAGQRRIAASPVRRSLGASSALYSDDLAKDKRQAIELTTGWDACVPSIVE